MGSSEKLFFETYSEQESLEKEVQLIQELQTHVDHGNGGANLTLGGDGTSGYKFTKEQRETLKKVWKDSDYRKKQEEKLNEARKKRWEDPESSEKMGESMKKLWGNFDHMKK